MKSFLTVLSLFTALIITSCNDDNDNDTICTDEFVIITVSITDQNQNPVTLDSFKVLNTENGHEITIPLSLSELTAAQELGQYPLIQDGILGVNQRQKIQFKGFLDNQEVVSSDYTVGTDCCHVGVISGNLELIL